MDERTDAGKRDTAADGVARAVTLEPWWGLVAVIPMADPGRLFRPGLDWRCPPLWRVPLSDVRRPIPVGTLLGESDAGLVLRWDGRWEEAGWDHIAVRLASIMADAGWASSRERVLRAAMERRWVAGLVRVAPAPSGAGVLVSARVQA